MLIVDENHTIESIGDYAFYDRNLPKRTRYYQGMIDLNILEKGNDYKDLKRSFVIFVCTFDLFGEQSALRMIEDGDLSLFKSQNLPT